jgi:dTDP-4-amino-4,6-dideoxygalactose transaminase
VAAPENDPIPMMALHDEIAASWDELTEAVSEVLRSTSFILGPNVAAFEAEVAEYLGADHAIGVNSGTDALVIALRALGVEPGQEVITTPFTFFATAEAISMVGAEPVFVDIDPKTLNIDPAAVAAAVTPSTAAVIPVHLFGLPADLDGIRAAAGDLPVIEDTAQAMGAEHGGRKLGAIGDVGCFSFFPSKTLGGFGDGGLLTTNDESTAEVAKMLRAHGGRRKYHNEMLGYNSRLDELQAALLRVKLPRLDELNAGRTAAAHRYNALLAESGSVITPPAEQEVFHQYTIRVANGRRDAVAAELADRDIASMIYYPIPVHRLPVYSHLDVSCPHAEQAGTEVLSLPIWPTIPASSQERVVEAVRHVTDR